VIVALAGRRVDAKDQEYPRFPSTFEVIAAVRHRIRHKFRELGATVLVSSAACGADILALEEAAILHMRRRVVLPFDREKFRLTSVTDRPGNWGALYDTVLDEVQAADDLIILPPVRKEKVYLETNHHIISEALSLSKSLQNPVVAVLVWEGKSRGEGDLTEEFGHHAKMQGLPLHEVLIC